MPSKRAITWFLGSAILAVLAVLVPVAIPALLPSSISQRTAIGTVVVSEAIVLLAIAIVWVTMRARRSRLGRR